MEAQPVIELTEKLKGEIIEVERHGLRIEGRLERVDNVGILISFKELGFALIHGKYDDCILEKYYFIPHEEIITISWTK